MSHFPNIDDFFGKKKIKKKWTLENVRDEDNLFQKLIQISSDIQKQYGVDQSLSHQVALLGINASNGLIESSKELLEYFGLKELEEVIIDQYQTIYREAGLINRPLPKIDILGKYIYMIAEMENEKSGGAIEESTAPLQQQDNTFSFLDSL